MRTTRAASTSRRGTPVSRHAASTREETPRSRMPSSVRGTRSRFTRVPAGYSWPSTQERTVTAASASYRPASWGHRVTFTGAQVTSTREMGRRPQRLHVGASGRTSPNRAVMVPRRREGILIPASVRASVTTAWVIAVRVMYVDPESRPIASSTFAARLRSASRRTSAMCRAMAVRCTLLRGGFMENPYGGSA